MLMLTQHIRCFCVEKKLLVSLSGRNHLFLDPLAGLVSAHLQKRAFPRHQNNYRKFFQGVRDIEWVPVINTTVGWQHVPKVYSVRMNTFIQSAVKSNALQC